MSRKSYIDTSDSYNPIIKISVDGRQYSFSISGFPDKDRDWLLSVLEGQMQEIHDRATKKATLKIQTAFKQLMSIDEWKI